MSLWQVDSLLYLAGLCDMLRWICNNGCYLDVFNFDIDFATKLWLSTKSHPPLLYKCWGIGYANKIYLKWWTILLASFSISNYCIDRLWIAKNHGKLQASICFCSWETVLQVNKICISKYLLLCVESKFSQIQPQIYHKCI